MHTSSDITTLVYKIVKGSKLNKLVSGHVYKHKRPNGVDGNYVIVDYLSGTSGLIQTFEVNVNVYVKDLLTNGEYFADDTKIAELSGVCAELLEHYDTTEYFIKYVDAPKSFEIAETHEHCINNLIKLTIRNL